MQANTAFIITISSILCLMGLLMFYIFRDKNNDLSCWQFIASKGVDGKERADADKLAKIVALFVLTGIVIMQAYKESLGEGLLLIYLSYCGGNAAWAAYLRSKMAIKGTPEKLPDQQRNDRRRIFPNVFGRIGRNDEVKKKGGGSGSDGSANASRGGSNKNKDKRKSNITKKE